MGCNASKQTAKATAQPQSQNSPTGQSNNNTAAIGKQDNTIQTTSSSSTESPGQQVNHEPVTNNDGLDDSADKTDSQREEPLGEESKGAHQEQEPNSTSKPDENVALDQHNATDNAASDTENRVKEDTAPSTQVKEDKQVKETAKSTEEPNPQSQPEQKPDEHQEQKPDDVNGGEQQAENDSKPAEEEPPKPHQGEEQDETTAQTDAESNKPEEATEVPSEKDEVQSETVEKTADAPTASNEAENAEAPSASAEEPAKSPEAPVDITQDQAETT